MNTTLQFATFIMVVVILIVVVAAVSLGREMVKNIQSDVENIREQNDFHEHSEVPAEETSEFPAVRDEPRSIPLDPNDPPKLKVYRGPAGRRQCTCHGNDVQPDQKVWLWPWPVGASFEGRVDIYCESWMREQGNRA